LSSSGEEREKEKSHQGRVNFERNKPKRKKGMVSSRGLMNHVGFKKKFYQLGNPPIRKPPEGKSPSAGGEGGTVWATGGRIKEGEMLLWRGRCIEERCSEGGALSLKKKRRERCPTNIAETQRRTIKKSAILSIRGKGKSHLPLCKKGEKKENEFLRSPSK